MISSVSKHNIGWMNLNKYIYIKFILHVNILVQKSKPYNYKDVRNKQNIHNLAISTDFWRAWRRLLIILGSPGGALSFKGPFLMARKIGAEFSVGGKTKQSIYTRTSVFPSPMVIKPNLAPPGILSTCLFKMRIITHFKNNWTNIILS